MRDPFALDESRRLGAEATHSSTIKQGVQQRLENSELYAIFGTAMSMSISMLIALHFLLIASRNKLV